MPSPNGYHNKSRCNCGGLQAIATGGNWVFNQSKAVEPAYLSRMFHYTAHRRARTSPATLGRHR
eukprot:2345749-Amphidinium_carterae.1